MELCRRIYGGETTVTQELHFLGPVVGSLVRWKDMVSGFFFLLFAPSNPLKGQEEDL